MHKDAYKVALEGQSPAKAARAVVRAMDQVYYSAAFYLKARSSEEDDDYLQRITQAVANLPSLKTFLLQGISSCSTRRAPVSYNLVGVVLLPSMASVYKIVFVPYIGVTVA